MCPPPTYYESIGILIAKHFECRDVVCHVFHFVLASHHHLFVVDRVV